MCVCVCICIYVHIDIKNHVKPDSIMNVISLLPNYLLRALTVIYENMQSAIVCKLSLTAFQMLHISLSTNFERNRVFFEKDVLFKMPRMKYLDQR